MEVIMSPIRKLALSIGALLVSLGAIVVTPAVTSAVPPDGTMLTLGWDSGGYYSVNPADASTTLLGTSTLLSSTGLAWDSSTGTLFGMDYDNSPASLYVLDPDNGAATIVGSMGLDEPTGLDVQPGTGSLFITYDDPEGGGSILATVSKSTAAVTDIAPTLDAQAAVRIGALAFHPTTGVLYGMGYDDSFYLVDPATGALTLIDSDLGLGGAVGLTFDCTGTLYSAESNLYTIDPATGTVTDLGELGLVASTDDFVENLTVICGAAAPTTTTTAAPTTTAPAVEAVEVVPTFTG
jgi:hypothetical protein